MIRIIAMIALLEIGSFAVGNCDGAGNCYVANIATGNGSGTDWGNACLDFTGACDVTSASMRGTTIWVGGSPGDFSTGKWTGPAYTVQNFTAPDSGTQTITIRGAAAYNHGTDTGWKRQMGTGIIEFFGPLNITTDYWVFDGQYRAFNPGHTQSNGGGVYHDSPLGYHIQVLNTNLTANAISISGSNVTIQFVYVQGATGTQGTTGGTYGQNASDNGIFYSSGVSNEYVGYSWIGYTGADLVKASAGSNFTFEYDLFTKNHMGTVSLASQAISIGDLTGLIVRYNHFQDITGVAMVSDPQADANAFTPNWYFYGNDIFWDSVVHSGAGYGLTGGMVNLAGETLNGGVIHVFNNTIAGINVAACGVAQPCNASGLVLSGLTNGSCGAHTQNCIGATAPAGNVLNNLWWNPWAATNFVNPTNAQWTPGGDYGEAICATTGCPNNGNFITRGPNDVFVATGNPFKSFNGVMGSPNWYNFNFLLTADTAPGFDIPGWTIVPSGCSMSGTGNNFGNCEILDPVGVTRGVNGVIDRGAFQINNRTLLTIGTTNTAIGIHIGGPGFQLTPVCTWSSAPTSDACPDGTPPFVKQWLTYDALTATVNSTGLVSAVSNHNAFISLLYGGLQTHNIAVMVTDGLGTRPVATLPTGIVRTGTPTAFANYDTTAFDSNFPTVFSDPCPVNNPPTCTRWGAPPNPLITTNVQFTSTLNSSQPGDTIVLQAGTIYSTGGPFTLPARANPSHKWTYIVSSNLSSLGPPGTRVKPSDAANMATIVGVGGTVPLTAGAGADHWWLAGIEIYGNTTAGQCPTCQPPSVGQSIGAIGTNSPAWPLSSMVDSITVDRCYLHGTATTDMHHLVTLNASRFAILDSFIGPSYTWQSQSNAASSYYAPGPVKIIDNLFWAGGQDLIFGGAGGFVNMWMLRDAYIARNTFWNDPSTRVVGVTIPPLNPHQVCSNFELKTCERCLVDGNLMQNSWISCQAGGQLLYNLATFQSGPDQVVSDITMSNNILTGSLQGMFTAEFGGPGIGCDQSEGVCYYPGEQRRLSYFNNLFVMGPQGAPGGRVALGSNAISVSIPRGQADTLYQHNTLVGPYLTDHIYCDEGFYFNPATNNSGVITDLPPSQNIWLLDNVSCRQTFGAGTQGNHGTAALNFLMADPSAIPITTRFYGNVMQLYTSLGDTQATWPPNNQATFSNFTYNNPGAGDYTLTSPVQTGSDGQQTGIRYSTIVAHQAPPLGTCSIVGNVSGAISSGVAMTLTGGSTTTIYSNPDGTYAFPNLATGSYTVTPFAIPPYPGSNTYTFNPTSSAITLTTGSCSSVGNNFTATASATFSISGTVTLSGAGQAGVSVGLTGTSTGAATTDASGNYTFTGLGPGSYTLKPSHAGFTYNPPTLSETISNANITGANFTATAAATFTISGTVTGVVISGISIQLSGAGAGQTFTDANGNYSFANEANGTYTVTPALAGYSFTPASQSVTINNANVTVPPFTSTAVTYSISGTISGAVTSGVTLQLRGPVSTTITSGTGGNYTFSNLPNGAYTITPSLRGFTFTPSTLGVTISGANVTGQNFTSVAISGTILSVGHIGPGTPIKTPTQSKPK